MLFAYIDPGAGSLVIQAVLAAVLAIPILVRSQLGAILRRIRERGGASTDRSPR